jgi:aryl-alcohol dehydrogenase
MRVQAAVLRVSHGPFVVEDVELGEPGPGEVLVEVAGAGLCHTDLIARHGVCSLPVVLGHEGSGVVVAAGPGVSGVTAGDHVVMSFDSCGSCDRCRCGDPAYCAQFLLLNLAGVRLGGSTPMVDGAGRPVSARWFGQSSFATHAIATTRNVVVVDPSLPLELLGPLGCSVQTGAGAVLLALGVGPESSIVILGTGAVGLAAVMAARVAGAREIIAVDLHAGRRALSTELGATTVIDGADPDVAAQIVARTSGGADFAFDTTGISEVIATALASIRDRGVCALVGVGGQITLPPGALMGGRVLTHLMEGDAVPQVFIPRLIELWQRGVFPFDRLIHTYPLAKINDAELGAASGETVKPVLLPTAPDR